MIPSKVQEFINSNKPTLPEYIQETLDSFDWLSICSEIAAKYRCTERQEEAFMMEVVMLVYELSEAELFKINIMNHIGVSEMIAHNMIIDVQTRIISRLQTELERIVGDAPEVLAQQLRNNGNELQQVEIHPFVNPLESTTIVETTPNHDPYHEPID